MKEEEEGRRVRGAEGQGGKGLEMVVVTGLTVPSDWPGVGCIRIWAKNGGNTLLPCPG